MWWIDLVIDVAGSLIVTGVTALAVFLFTKKYYSKLAFGKKMRSYGFLEAVTTNVISNRERREIFNEYDEIDIIYVSGWHFMRDNQALIRKALARGARIRFLCAQPYGLFQQDVERLEFFEGNRKPSELIGKEVEEIRELYRTSGLQMRYYSTEYRMPFILARKGKDEIRAWLTVTLCPYKSVKSFVLRGMLKSSDVLEESEKEINFIEMMQTHFNSVWEQSRDAYADCDGESESNCEE